MKKAILKFLAQFQAKFLLRCWLISAKQHGIHSPQCMRWDSRLSKALMKLGDYHGLERPRSDLHSLPDNPQIEFEFDTDD